MIRHALAAAVLLAATPLSAQSTTQDEIDARYDRALAAGYKALFLCSAIANAERIGATRTPESVEQWELSGIQAPLDAIVPSLPYRIVRQRIQNDISGELEETAIDNVQVDWSTDMAPRTAYYSGNLGCWLAPTGTKPMYREPSIEHGSDGAADLASVAIPTQMPPKHALEATLARAFGGDYGEGTRTTAVLIREKRKNGEVLELSRALPDFDGRPQRTWSVAKSIAATLVGAAVHRGKVKVSDSARLGRFFVDRRSDITIDHLLRMASGRYSDTPGNRTDPLYFGGATVEESALHWPLVHEPGSVYRYANNDTLAAVKALGEDLSDHPPAAFFEQVGMRETVAETDGNGDYILSSQVWSTARDPAKLGQLYLDDGVLPDGTRILPEGWVEYVSSPSGPQPDGSFGYGAGFWLLNTSDGVPPDTFAAMGNRGQFIIIVPSLNVVIVRRGEDPAGSRFDIASFTRDVLESIAE